MKKNILIFIIGFIVAFTGGYLFMGTGDDSATGSENASNTEEEAQSSEETETEAVDEATVLSDEGEILSQNNCLSCHAVESIGAPGGTTGPDLSNVYNDVEGKHGLSLDEFLQEPTSAVMSTVIEGDPLSDEERESIVEALKKAAESN